MRIVLVQPPVRDFYETGVRLQPIGLCYIKAALLEFCPEIEVTIVDGHSGRGRRTIPVPKELSYLKSYYGEKDLSPFCTFHQYYHFGAPIDELASEVLALKPDLIGIASLFTPYHREALELADALKQKTLCPIVIGGAHASAVPDHVLAHPTVDFVIVGEGERPMCQLVEALRSKKDLAAVSNLGFKISGEHQWTKKSDNYPLDELPPPDLSDLPQARYTFEGRPMTFMITSRSCPHKCSFCSVHTVFGRAYKRRNLECVKAEIELRYTQGYRVIDFEDDNLTFYKKEFKALCEWLILRFEKNEMQFVAMNGISYLSLDRDLLGLMKQAGFTHLNLALVSSDQSVRESTKRPHTIQKYLEIVDGAHDLGFQIVSYQILGLPFEPLASQMQTLAFNSELPVLLGASMFYETPGAPISRPLPELTEIDFFKSRLTAMAIKGVDFGRDEVFTLFILTRVLDFFKGLSVVSDRALSDVLKTTSSDARTQMGLDVFNHWLETGQWLRKTPRGGRVQTHFSNRVAIQFFSQLKSVRTTQGTVLKNDLFGGPKKPHVLLNFEASANSENTQEALNGGAQCFG